MADDDSPHAVKTVTAALVVLSWVAVLIRIYVKAWLIQAIGLDDGFAVATLVGFPVRTSIATAS